MSDPRKALTVSRDALRDPDAARAALADLLAMIEFEQSLPGIANIRQAVRINDAGHAMSLNAMMYAMLTGNYGFSSETMNSPIMRNLLTAARIPMIAEDIAGETESALNSLACVPEITLHQDPDAARFVRDAKAALERARNRAVGMPPQKPAVPLPYPESIRTAPADVPGTEANPDGDVPPAAQHSAAQGALTDGGDLPPGRVRNGAGDVMPFERSLHGFGHGRQPSEGIRLMIEDAAGDALDGVTLDIHEGRAGARVYVQAVGQVDMTGRRYAAAGRAGLYDVRRLRTALHKTFPEKLPLAEIAKLNRRDAEGAA